MVDKPRKKRLGQKKHIGYWRIVSTKGSKTKSSKTKSSKKLKDYLCFGEAGDGHFQFENISGTINWSPRKGEPAADWSWGAKEPSAQTHGRGTASVSGGKLHGKIFFHEGGEVSFTAKEVCQWTYNTTSGQWDRVDSCSEPNHVCPPPDPPKSIPSSDDVTLTEITDCV
jgi:hypothetical protein